MASLSPLLQRALHSIETTTAGMTDEEMLRHPEGKWSPAEILEHLSLAYSTTVTRMRDLLEKPQGVEVRHPSLRERIAGFLVIRLNYIPPGRKSPERIVPKGISPAEAHKAVRAGLADIDQVISECAQRFGTRSFIMVHPILGPLTVKEWRKFHCVHTLHHMRQVQRMRQSHT
ncbi:MAG: hypothetical protein DMG65_23655 [Candidatus Angelobacter sp. Gp1-AA117]|nr:MAG: hypothetical protein DMG65_23655 [Candidatus Angelobacter sp. Gp1-AA117]